MMEPVSIHADYRLLDMSIQCGICEKDFNPDDLEAHMKTHDAEESAEQKSSCLTLSSSGVSVKETPELDKSKQDCFKSDDRKINKPSVEFGVPKSRNKETDSNAVEVIIQVFNKEHHESDKKLIDEVAVSVEKINTAGDKRINSGMKGNHNEKDKAKVEPVTCEMCGKQFDTKKKLSCHKRVHKKKDDNESNKIKTHQSENQHAKKRGKKIDGKKDGKKSDVQKDRKKADIQKDRKKTDVQKDREETYVHKEGKETDGKNNRKVTGVQKEVKKTDEKKDGKETDIQKDGKKSDVQKDGKKTVVERDGKKTDKQKNGKETDIQKDGKVTDAQKDRKVTDAQEEGEVTNGKIDRKVTDVQNDEKNPDEQIDGKEIDIQKNGKKTDVQKDGKKTDVQKDGKKTDTQKEGKKTDGKKERKKTDVQKDKKKIDVQKKTANQEVKDGTKIDENKVLVEAKKNTTPIVSLQKTGHEQLVNTVNVTNAISVSNIGEGNMKPRKARKPRTKSMKNKNQSSGILEEAFLDDLKKSPETCCNVGVVNKASENKSGTDENGIKSRTDENGIKSRTDENGIKSRTDEDSVMSSSTVQNSAISFTDENYVKSSTGKNSVRSKACKTSIKVSTDENSVKSSDTGDNSTKLRTGENSVNTICSTGDNHVKVSNGESSVKSNTCENSLKAIDRQVKSITEPKLKSDKVKFMKSELQKRVTLDKKDNSGTVLSLSSSSKSMICTTSTCMPSSGVSGNELKLSVELSTSELKEANFNIDRNKSSSKNYFTADKKLKTNLALNNGIQMKASGIELAQKTHSFNEAREGSAISDLEKKGLDHYKENTNTHEKDSKICSNKIVNQESECHSNDRRYKKAERKRKPDTDGVQVCSSNSLKEKPMAIERLSKDINKAEIKHVTDLVKDSADIFNSELEHLKISDQNFYTKYSPKAKNDLKNPTKGKQLQENSTSESALGDKELLKLYSIKSSIVRLERVKTDLSVCSGMCTNDTIYENKTKDEKRECVPKLSKKFMISRNSNNVSEDVITTAQKTLDEVNKSSSHVKHSVIEDLLNYKYINKSSVELINDQIELKAKEKIQAVDLREMSQIKRNETTNDDKQSKTSRKRVSIDPNSTSEVLFEMKTKDSNDNKNRDILPKDNSADYMINNKGLPIEENNSEESCHTLSNRTIDFPLKSINRVKKKTRSGRGKKGRVNKHVPEIKDLKMCKQINISVEETSISEKIDASLDKNPLIVDHSKSNNGQEKQTCGESIETGVTPEYGYTQQSVNKMNENISHQKHEKELKLSSSVFEEEKQSGCESIRKTLKKNQISRALECDGVNNEIRSKHIRKRDKKMTNSSVNETSNEIEICKTDKLSKTQDKEIDRKCKAVDNKKTLSSNIICFEEFSNVNNVVSFNGIENEPSISDCIETGETESVHSYQVESKGEQNSDTIQGKESRSIKQSRRKGRKRGKKVKTREDLLRENLSVSKGKQDNNGESKENAPEILEDITACKNKTHSSDMTEPAFVENKKIVEQKSKDCEKSVKESPEPQSDDKKNKNESKNQHPQKERKNRRKKVSTEVKLFTADLKIDKEINDDDIENHKESKKSASKIPEGLTTGESKIGKCDMAEPALEKGNKNVEQKSDEFCQNINNVNSSDKTHLSEGENMKDIDVPTSNASIIDPVKLPEEEIEQTLFALGLGTSSIALSESNSKTKNTTKKRRIRSKSPQLKYDGNAASQTDKKWFQNFDPLNSKKLRNRTGKSSWLKHTFDSDTNSDGEWEIELPLVENQEKQMQNTPCDAINVKKPSSINKTDFSKYINSEKKLNEKSSFDKSKDRMLCKQFGITNTKVVINRLSDIHKKKPGSHIVVTVSHQHNSNLRHVKDKEICKTQCQLEKKIDVTNNLTVNDGQTQLDENKTQTEKDVGNNDKTTSSSKINATDLFKKHGDESEAYVDGKSKFRKANGAVPRGRKRKRSLDINKAKKASSITGDGLSIDNAEIEANKVHIISKKTNTMENTCVLTQSANDDTDNKKQILKKYVEKHTCDRIHTIHQNIIEERKAEKDTVYDKEVASQAIKNINSQKDEAIDHIDSEHDNILCSNINETTNTDVLEQCNIQRALQKTRRKQRRGRGRKKGWKLDKSNIIPSDVKNTNVSSSDTGRDTTVDEIHYDFSTKPQHEKQSDATEGIIVEKTDINLLLQSNNVNLDIAPGILTQDYDKSDSEFVQNNSSMYKKEPAKNNAEICPSSISEQTNIHEKKKRGRPRSKRRTQSRLNQRDTANSFYTDINPDGELEQSTDVDISNETVCENSLHGLIKDGNHSDRSLCAQEQADQLPPEDSKSLIESIKANQKDTEIISNSCLSQVNTLRKQKNTIGLIAMNIQLHDSNKDNHNTKIQKQTDTNTTSCKNVNKISCTGDMADNTAKQENVNEDNNAKESWHANSDGLCKELDNLKENKKKCVESLPILKDVDNPSCVSRNRQARYKAKTSNLKCLVEGKEQLKMTEAFTESLVDTKQTMSCMDNVSVSSNILPAEDIRLGIGNNSRKDTSTEQSRDSSNKQNETLSEITLQEGEPTYDEINKVKDSQKKSGPKRKRGRSKSKKKGAYKKRNEAYFSEVIETHSDVSNLNQIADIENTEDRPSKTDHINESENILNDIDKIIQDDQSTNSDKIRGRKQTTFDIKSFDEDINFVSNPSSEEKEKQIDSAEFMIQESETSFDTTRNKCTDIGFADSSISSTDISHTFIKEKIKNNENVNSLELVKGKKIKRGRLKVKGKGSNVSKQETIDREINQKSIENTADVAQDIPLICDNSHIDNHVQDRSDQRHEDMSCKNRESCTFTTTAEIHSTFQPAQQDEEASTNRSILTYDPQVHKESLNQTENVRIDCKVSDKNNSLSDNVKDDSKSDVSNFDVDNDNRKERADDLEINNIVKNQEDDHQSKNKPNHEFKLLEHCDEQLVCQNHEEFNQEVTPQECMKGQNYDDEMIIINEDEYTIRKRGRPRRKEKEKKDRKSSTDLKNLVKNSSTNILVHKSSVLEHDKNAQPNIDVIKQCSSTKITKEKDESPCNTEMSVRSKIPKSPKIERNIFHEMSKEQTDSITEICKVNVREEREAMVEISSLTHTEEISDCDSKGLSSNHTETDSCPIQDYIGSRVKTKQLNQRNDVPHTFETTAANKVVDIIHLSEEKIPTARSSRKKKKGKLCKNLFRKDTANKTDSSEFDYDTGPHKITMNESAISSQEISNKEKEHALVEQNNIAIDKTTSMGEILDGSDVMKMVDHCNGEKKLFDATEDLSNVTVNICEDAPCVSSEPSDPLNDITDSQQTYGSFTDTENISLTNITENEEVKQFSENDREDFSEDTTEEHNVTTENVSGTNWPSDIVLAFTPLEVGIVNRKRKHRKKRKKMFKIVQSMNDYTNGKDESISIEKTAGVSDGKGFYIQRITDSDNDFTDQNCSADEKQGKTDLVNPKLILQKKGNKSWEAKTSVKLCINEETTLDTSIERSIDSGTQSIQHSDDECLKIVRVNDGKICTEDYAEHKDKEKSARIKRKNRRQNKNALLVMKKNKIQDQDQINQESKDASLAGTVDFTSLLNYDSGHKVRTQEEEQLSGSAIDDSIEEAMYCIQPGSARENVLVMKRLGSPHPTSELSHDSSAFKVDSELKHNDNSELMKIKADAVNSLPCNTDENIYPQLSQDHLLRPESKVEESDNHGVEESCTLKTTARRRGRRHKRNMSNKSGPSEGTSDIVKEKSKSKLLKPDEDKEMVLCNSEMFKIDNLLLKDDGLVSNKLLSTTVSERDGIGVSNNWLNETDTSADCVRNTLIDSPSEIDFTNIAISKNTHIQDTPTEARQRKFRAKRGRGKKRKVNENTLSCTESSPGFKDPTKRLRGRPKSSVVKTSCDMIDGSVTNIIQDFDSSEIVRRSQNLSVKLVRLSQADIDKYTCLGASTDNRVSQQTGTRNFCVGDDEDLIQTVGEVINDMICAICEDEADKVYDTLFYEQVGFSSVDASSTNQFKKAESVYDIHRHLQPFCTDSEAHIVGNKSDHTDSESIKTFDLNSVLLGEKDFETDQQCSEDDNGLLNTSEKIDVIDFESALNDEQILLKEDLDSTKMAASFDKSMDPNVNDETDLFYEETDDIIDRNIVQNEDPVVFGLQDELHKEISEIGENTINRQLRFDGLEGETGSSYPQHGTGCPDVSKIISNVNNISYRLKKVCGKIKSDRLDGFEMRTHRNEEKLEGMGAYGNK